MYGSADSPRYRSLRYPQSLGQHNGKGGVLHPGLDRYGAADLAGVSVEEGEDVTEEETKGVEEEDGLY